jgi:hypothetical protein
MICRGGYWESILPGVRELVDAATPPHFPAARRGQVRLEHLYIHNQG